MTWQYQDLIDEFYLDVEKYKNEYYSHDEAINITFNEFYSENIVDEMERALIYILYAELSLQNPRIYNETKQVLLHELESIDLNRIRSQIIDGQLNQEQFEEISIRKDEVIKKLKLMPIDSCNQARWYYSEIRNAVSNFYLELVAQNMDSDEIIDQVLSRYKRGCDRTPSVKITVYITLAEILLKNNQTISKEIIDEISGFKMDSINEELSLDELTDLSRAVKNVLE
ncbi:Imm3 family immunity protein [Paenibacillus taichungensis]